MSGYKIRDQFNAHFLTFTLLGWIDLFSRKECKQIILDSLKYCQREKGLIIHAYVIMESHLHIVASAKEDSSGLSAIIRDFKKHTSKQLIKWIQESKRESRSEWLIFILQTYTKKLKKTKNFQVWQHSNRPKVCVHPKFTFQKIRYIHHNPVKSEIVSKPEHYIYSSARNYAGLNDYVLDVDVISVGSMQGYITM